MHVCKDQSLSPALKSGHLKPLLFVSLDQNKWWLILDCVGVHAGLMQQTKHHSPCQYIHRIIQPKSVCMNFHTKQLALFLKSISNNLYKHTNLHQYQATYMFQLLIQHIRQLARPDKLKFYPFAQWMGCIQDNIFSISSTNLGAA